MGVTAEEGKVEGLQSGAQLWDMAASRTPHLHSSPQETAGSCTLGNGFFTLSSGLGNETRPQIPRSPQEEVSQSRFRHSGPSMTSVKRKERLLPIWLMHVERRL